MNGYADSAVRATPLQGPSHFYMTSPVPRADPRGSSLSRTLTDLLQSAGLSKADTIRITGPAGLAALLWFCRHGYEQVGYVSTRRGCSEEGDLLLVPQTCSVGEL